MKRARYFGKLRVIRCFCTEGKNCSAFPNKEAAFFNSGKWDRKCPVCHKYFYYFTEDKKV